MNRNYLSLLEAGSFSPLSLKSPDAWCGHTPFASWLIRILEPQIFVELGTHSGNSYFSFCQAVQEAKIETKCYAVDTWQGDPHAGMYGEEIFEYITSHHQTHYSSFSRLLRMKFDEAVNYFSDGSIDLLHIDGLHTYEAVKHDFETWLPKLSSFAVVLFHDTNVRTNEFGVWKFWEELQSRYPNNLEFLHSHGLGVLQLNGVEPNRNLEWLAPDYAQKAVLKGYFSALGERQLERFEYTHVKTYSDTQARKILEQAARILTLEQTTTEQDSKIGDYHHAVLNRDDRIAQLERSTTECDLQMKTQDASILERNSRIADLEQAVANRDIQTAAQSDAILERNSRIADLEQAVANRDIQTAAQSDAILERNSRIADLKHEAVERDAQIAAYHDAVLDRDISLARITQDSIEHNILIESYHNAAINREEIIHQLQQSNSWLITKPLRGVSKIIGGMKSLILKAKVSNLIRLSELIKPHIYAIYKDPNLLRVKLMFLAYAWREGGLNGVVGRLVKSRELSFSAKDYDYVESPQTTSLMQYLADSVNPPILGEHKKTPPITVVIPVYRGAKETARCIESVLGSSNKTLYRIIILNDASPEIEVDSFLRSLDRKHSHIKILRNKKNLGFVGTVNRGMMLRANDDIILLNSDTVVANNWLDRLVAQAYASEAIGTVTPFSNNATICNYPDLDGWKLLPGHETIQQIDHAFSIANPGKRIDIPTAVGFCMYIKQKCLQEVGLFDEEAFGKGYGEENDFCLKAAKKGWHHILAADVFVFHEGEISFSKSATHKKMHAMNIMRSRYPDYENIISSHIALNAAYPYRVAATAARYRLSNRPIVLFITHRLGGGVEKHAQELADAITKDGARVLFMRPTNGQNGCDLILESHTKDDKLKIDLSSNNIQLLAEALNAFGITKTHIHHTIEFGFSVEELARSINAPYDLTIHDFYPICPRINLINPAIGYCGTPNTDDCNSCLAIDPSPGSEIEIIWWRAQFASLLNGARNVYCPSDDAARRIAEHFPLAPIKMIPHEEIEQIPLRHTTAQKRSFRRFAILGVLAQHKGLSLIEETLAVIDRNNWPIELVIIGYAERTLPSNPRFKQTGPYQDNDLQTLIEKTDPDAILFPARCPETYSYTLSSAILSGRPLVVSNIGALPERAKLTSKAFIFPHNFSGEELAQYLLSLDLSVSEAEKVKGL